MAKLINQGLSNPYSINLYREIQKLKEYAKQIMIFNCE